MRLYVFGESLPQFPDYRHLHFCCLYHISGATAEQEQQLRLRAEEEREAGREAYLHDGETAGRDCYPARPSTELADALRRAGWLRCHAPIPSERDAAIRLGVPV